MHIEQNQMNLGSRVRSLSFCFLLNSHIIKITIRKRDVNKAMALEKSRLIIFSRKVNLYSLPEVRSEISLLYKKVVPDITHTQKIDF